MSIFHKILVGLIFLTIPFNFFFACRTLKTHQIWREKIIKLEKQIEQTEKESYELKYGVRDKKTGELTQKGILQIECELDSIMFQRGRAWLNASAEINTETGEVKLDGLTPNPHNIVVGTILYCFDSVWDKDSVNTEGRYLGKFTVTDVDETGIVVEPSMDMTQSISKQRFIDKLKTASEEWDLYEKMPRDEHAMYAKMSEDAIRDLMPSATVDEFINDGKDDPEKPGMKYERKLRDYERIFDSVSSKSAKLENLIVSAQFDEAYTKNALEDAKGLETAQENLKKQLTDQRDKVQAEYDAIANHLKTLNARYQLYVEKIQKVRAENIKLAKQIDAAQREAAKRIYARANASGVASAF